MSDLQDISLPAIGSRPVSRFGLALRALECLGLFVLFPLVVYWKRASLIGLFFPVLFGLAVLALVVLLFDRSFEKKRLWNARQAVRRMPIIWVRFALLAIPVSLYVWWAKPERFLGFPRENREMWMVVMVLYPLLSAYPQELFFRTFFFHRYGCLFPSPTVMIVVNALAFGLAHLFFGNWIAPVLSTAGGLLFAHTYSRTGSTLAVTVEHGLWGDFIFTIGLGWYFYAISFS